MGGITLGVAVLVWRDGGGGSIVYSPDACVVTTDGNLVCETGFA